MNRSRRRADVAAPQRPITFRAAKDLGTFELAQLWADRTAWPIEERSQYDELAELAVMSALATWLCRCSQSRFTVRYSPERVLKQ
ncbi:MAG: hypothetical protein ACRDOU_22975 [Streptosporangiaceae bacterium]